MKNEKNIEIENCVTTTTWPADYNWVKILINYQSRVEPKLSVK